VGSKVNLQHTAQSARASSDCHKPRDLLHSAPGVQCHSVQCNGLDYTVARTHAHTHTHTQISTTSLLNCGNY